jgi:hypothetical protein
MEFNFLRVMMRNILTYTIFHSEPERYMSNNPEEPIHKPPAEEQ